MKLAPIDVEKEYEKDKNLNREDVATLLEWILKQPHLPKLKEFDSMIALHSRYYRLERAKLVIENFYTIRTLCPEMFNYDEDDTMLRLQLDISYFLILPQKKPGDEMIIFLKLKNTNPDLWNLLTQAKATIIVPLLYVFMHGIPAGVRIIIDFEGGTLGHLAKVNIMVAKKYLYFLQEALPLRLKSVHFINLVPWIDKLMMFAKPFLRREFYDLIHFHHNLEGLFEVIPQVLMPNEYGGQAGSLDDMQKKSNFLIFDNSDFFLEFNKLVVDETKRVAEIRNELFGISGSFKQLEFD